MGQGEEFPKSRYSKIYRSAILDFVGCNVFMAGFGVGTVFRFTLFSFMVLSLLRLWASAVGGGSVGVVVFRFCGVVVLSVRGRLSFRGLRGSEGVVVLWCCGVVVLGYSGVVVFWYYGFLVFRLSVRGRLPFL